MFEKIFVINKLVKLRVGKVAGTQSYRKFSLEGTLYMDMHQLINISYDIDDFCNELEQHCKNYMLSGPTKSDRGLTCSMAISEIMTILVMFRYRDFKNFYNRFLKFYHKDCFPKLPSYERFVHLMS